MKPLCLAFALCSGLGVQSASAVFFYYTPASSSVLPINHVAMPVIQVDATCCAVIDTTFHVHTVVVTGLGGSTHGVTTDATLTTNALGEVIAWTMTVEDVLRPRILDYGSSYQAGVFSDWLQLSTTVVPSSWVDEGPVYFSTRGTWTSSLTAVPEPRALPMALAGVGLLVGLQKWRRSRRDLRH